MNHDQLTHLALSYPGTQLKYPFDPDLPVFYVGSKMFALLGHQEGFPSVNLKTTPEEAWMLREAYPGTVLPGYHMNKQHWNTILLNGKVPSDILVGMLEDSYRLVFANLRKSERETIRPSIPVAAQAQEEWHD
ncbi:putative DNA-binding protein (MmcQ/YjbR family) [Paenibacillus shirakamiensis]|uniref:DNA-binding protein (MmcQ/YjbR family) n=1 Tax=Paenibacillus shirakamiensis TaxID=1265935 RepID=A0ABS4JM21_9BACL|nr:MmcQ/YjbR family DNA-binding protein [Paenibacillus shirakamiensis]MBP2002763.1 putative DNA-binding protein (MmcQ/YjbR family) [Paenibacillus shirakamiensis]